MEICSQPFFIVDGKIFPKEEFDVWINGHADGVVYEVVRVVEGVPLFLEAHLSRLKNTLKLIQKTLKVSIEEIRYNILKIIQINNVKNGNFKLIVSKKSDVPFQIALWFQAHEYPTLEQYKNGVKVQLIELARENPNAKVQNEYYKSIVSEKLNGKEIYELLLSHDGIVTEGSKSNIYFVQNNQLVTPSKEFVLQGITRSKIAKLAQNTHISLIERTIKISELVDFQAAFITGTSPKVLPISEIEMLVKFNSKHPLILSIMTLYDQLIEADIQQFKKENIF